jgi:hypothetical protein
VVGVPDKVYVVPINEPVIPGGKLIGVIPVAPLPNVYDIGVNELELTHKL